MKNRNEQLDNLLRQFMDDAHLHDLKEDLAFADELFATHPSPPVRQQTLALIQKRVHRKLIQHRCWAVGRWIAAVAAILIVSLLSREHFMKTQDTSNMPRPITRTIYYNPEIWRDGTYVTNSQVDPIERELTELADALRAVSLKTYETTDTFSIDMMELDEIEHLADNASLGKDNFYAQ
jgi:hypothetical protein